MDPKFTVIMPLYNVGKYLTETIQCIISQSVGFEENIQLVLVNDGSTDETEQISKSFADRYPNNVTYVYQDNAGVSAARNAGMQYIKGKYVNFMDADDIWSPDSFELAWDMFESNGDSIDVVACRMDFFEDRSGFQKLDYKFDDGDMICDIFENPSYGQFAVCSAFCRASAIAGMSFDTRLSYGEDAKFINQLIIKKEKYGLLRSAEYHIRKRATNASLTQTKLDRETAYLDTAAYYYCYLRDLSVEKYGYVIPYVQYALLNALKYRVRAAVPESIPRKIREPYIKIVSDLLTQIDDDVICRAKNMSAETRLYILSEKHGNSDAKEMLSIEKGIAYICGIKAGRLIKKDGFVIESISRHLLETKITGYLQVPIVVEDISITVSAGKASRTCEVTDYPSKCRLSYKEDPFNKAFGFSVTLPAFLCKDPSSLKWTVSVDGSKVTVTPNHHICKQ